jgi:bifunctional ADP-heptose synthase (sugar kinase/adenylyltransferase)
MTLFRSAMAPAHVDIVGDDEVADVTGAGDTVIATFSAALAAGLSMEHGMRLANVAAGIVVTKVGTATASPEEISATAARYGVTLP